MLDHVELSVPEASLSPEFCADLDRLLVDVLGWSGTSQRFVHPIDRTLRVERVYRFGAGQALVLHEDATSFRAGADDHLGLVVDDTELDRVFTACRKLAADDDRLVMRYVVDGVPSAVDIGVGVFRTFFVKYLLPVWLQFESRGPGVE